MWGREEVRVCCGSCSRNRAGYKMRGEGKSVSGWTGMARKQVSQITFEVSKSSPFEHGYIVVASWAGTLGLFPDLPDEMKDESTPLPVVTKIKASGRYKIYAEDGDAITAWTAGVGGNTAGFRFFTPRRDLGKWLAVLSGLTAEP